MSDDDTVAIGPGTSTTDVLVQQLRAALRVASPGDRPRIRNLLESWTAIGNPVSPTSSPSPWEARTALSSITECPGRIPAGTAITRRPAGRTEAATTEPADR
jgi:hypothetical protein